MSLEHVTPADAVAIQPPPDPVERLYQELEPKVREYRPKDDLAPLERVRDDCQRHCAPSISIGLTCYEFA